MLIYLSYILYTPIRCLSNITNVPMPLLFNSLKDLETFITLKNSFNQNP